MKEDLILLGFSFLSFELGLGIMKWQFGITSSISIVFTKLEKWWQQLLFLLWYPMFLMPLTLIPEGDNWIITKVAFWLLLGIPVFANYKPKWGGILHVTALWLGVGFLLIGITLEFGLHFWVVLFWIFASSIYLFVIEHITKNITYWAEKILGYIMFVMILVYILV